MKKTAATVVSTAVGFAVVLGVHAARSSSHALAIGTPNATPSSKPTPATTSPATTSPATTSPASTGQAVSAVGTSEQYGYGVVSVKVTVEGGHITGVSVADLQTAEPYSQMLAQQAIPVLQQEVLQAQSVQVNGISGATYTTQAYLLSVQSALHKLHV